MSWRTRRCPWRLLLTWQNLTQLLKHDAHQTQPLVSMQSLLKSRVRDCRWMGEALRSAATSPSVRLVTELCSWTGGERALTVLHVWNGSGISNATLWRNKAVSCESVRSFEASRKAQIDVFQDKDRQYWQAFETEILRGREENTRLQRFFALRIQAVRLLVLWMIVQ